MSLLKHGDTIMNLNSSQRPHRRGVLLIRLHFMTAAAFVILCTGLPAFAQLLLRLLVC